MEDLKLVFAGNLVALRRRAKLTQAELAERLNYSDKAVSKWERAESVPDVTVLVSIAKFFDVTLDFLVTEHESAALAEEPLTKKTSSRNKILTYAIVAFGIFLAELVVFLAIGGAVPSLALRATYCFAFPLPLAAIVSVALCSAWKKKLLSFLSVSALVWSLVLDAYLIVRLVAFSLPWIFLVGLPAELIVAFSYGIIRRPDKSENQSAAKTEPESK